MANEIVFVRLTTSNKDTAKSFYSELFTEGWTFGAAFERNDRVWEPWEDGDGPKGDIVDKLGAEPLGWIPFVQVDDIDDAIELAIELGGTVKIGKTDFEEFYYAYIKDPSGAIIGLYQEIT